MNEIVASIYILFFWIFKSAFMYKRKSHNTFESLSVISKSDTSLSFIHTIYKLDTKSGYSNFNAIEKADPKKKTEFWHTEAFRTYVLITVRLFIQ